MSGSYLHQTKKVESAGSFWLIDEENCRYLRMPKQASAADLFDRMTTAALHLRSVA